MKRPPLTITLALAFAVGWLIAGLPDPCITLLVIGGLSVLCIYFMFRPNK